IVTHSFPRFFVLRQGVACFVAVLLTIQSLGAQTPQADKIRTAVGKIGTLGNITVDMRDGREYYGTIVRISQEDFTVSEVDLGRQIVLRYEEAKKVREGYGTTRNIRGKRIHPHTKLIVALAVIGGLLTLAFVAVATDKS